MVGTMELPSSSDKNVPMTPLPVGQVFCVCLVEVCEGVNINVLFPFLAFMVEDLGHSGSSLGYYAGGLAGAFCGAQFCSSVLWGKISDTYGRKPAIFFGTLGTALGMLVFGTSKTYTQAIIGRIISGFLCGNLGVVKSFLTEVTDETNRAKGFSLFSLGWFVGTVLAPITGGFLCKPAEKYPQIFSRDGLFATYPYLLPCLLCSIFNCSAAVLCWVVMVETRTPEKRMKKLGGSGKISMTTSSSSSSSSSSGKSSAGSIEMTIGTSSGRTTPCSSSGSRGASLKKPTGSSSGGKFTILAGEDEDEENELEDGQTEEQQQEEEVEAVGGRLVPSSGGTKRMGGSSYAKVSTMVSEEEDLTDDDDESLSPKESNNISKKSGGSGDVSSPLHSADGANAITIIATSGTSENEEDALCCPNGFLCCCPPASSDAATDGDSSLSVLRQWNVMLTCVNYGILAMAYIILEETIPLFLKLETPLGGFGFNSVEIGILLSISGGVMLFFTLLLLPKISCHSKLWLMRFSCLWAIPLGFAWPCLTLLNHNVLTGLAMSEGLKVAILWPLLVLVTVFKSVMSCLAFTAVMMQINHSVYDEHLGSVNGLGQSFASLARATGPALGGLLWSLSIEFHFVFFNFIAFGGILCLCIYLNTLLPASIDKKKHPKEQQLDLDEDNLQSV